MPCCQVMTAPINQVLPPPTSANHPMPLTTWSPVVRVVLRVPDLEMGPWIPLATPLPLLTPDIMKMMVATTTHPTHQHHPLLSPPDSPPPPKDNWSTQNLMSPLEGFWFLPPLPSPARKSSSRNSRNSLKCVSLFFPLGYRFLYMTDLWIALPQGPRKLRKCSHPLTPYWKMLQRLWESDPQERTPSGKK